MQIANAPCVYAHSQFGTKVMEPKPVLKALPPLFDTKDGKARDKVKELVVRVLCVLRPAFPDCVPECVTGDCDTLCM